MPTFKKISQLPAATAFNDTDLLEKTDNQSTPTSQKGTLTQLVTYLQSKFPFQLFTHFADSATSGTGQTALYTDAIAANTLVNNGDRIYACYYATASFGGTGYNATLTLQFAGNTIFNRVLAVSSPFNYYLEATIAKVTSTTARCSVILNTDDVPGGTAAIVSMLFTDLSGLNFTISNNLVLLGTSSLAGQTVTAKQGWGYPLR